VSGDFPGLSVFHRNLLIHNFPGGYCEVVVSSFGEKELAALGIVLQPEDPAAQDHSSSRSMPAFPTIIHGVRYIEAK